MCAPTEPLPLSDVFFCIAFISHFLSSLPRICRSQNTESQPFHLCPSGSSYHHPIKDPTLYTVIQTNLWTLELKLKKLRNDSDHNNVEYVEQTTLTFCSCVLIRSRTYVHKKQPPITAFVTIALWTAGMPPCLCSNPHLLPTAINWKVTGFKPFPSYDMSIRQQQMGNKLLAINVPESGKFTAKAITK